MRKLILNIVKYFFYISLIQLILTCKESPSRLKKVLEKQEFTIEKEVSDSKIEAYLQEMIFEEHFTGVAPPITRSCNQHLVNLLLKEVFCLNLINK